MTGPPVVGQPNVSPVLLVGQAPGSREVVLHRPFAWTAGKTLFRWLAQAGLSEEQVRARVYMAAVCRCFPGKAKGGGDRVPDRTEIETCGSWLAAEIRLLRPRLVLPVGKLAIGRFLACERLDAVIGRVHRAALPGGGEADVVPLPHPSGASVWHRTEPGMTLLAGALREIARHEAWCSLLDDSPPVGAGGAPRRPADETRAR